MTDLFQRSIEIILENQAPSGAYVASPNFPTYQYCWFRDGSFIAYAMDLVGQTQSAARFHAWAARAILQRADLVERAISKARAGILPESEDQLHTRYTLAGEDGTREEWPNYQLDGLGTWLWALGEHHRLSGRPLPAGWLKAAELAGDYLEALWPTPCYDCWEEFPNDIHPHTLATIYGGLNALSTLDTRNRDQTLNLLKSFIDQKAVHSGYIVKKIGSNTVDASLLGMAVPYNMVDLDDPRFTATVERIDSLLHVGGGVHRYAADTYYGGGEWILLTCWLGWVFARRGEHDRARTLLKWVEQQADAKGNLPEQVPANLNDPGYYQPWLERWGPIASPLLWSHAKYLILKSSLPSDPQEP